MITFVSLDTIIQDILNLARGSKLTQSEPLSKRQIEFWIHQYRALLIKQDLDKGKMANPDYIQHIPKLRLTTEDRSGTGVYAATGRNVYRSQLQLPKTLDLNFKPGLTYVGTVDGFEIQLVPESRMLFQQYRKYVENEPLAYLKNGYIYLEHSNQLDWITVKGIFEVPTEAYNFRNTYINRSEVDLEDGYPMPINMVPVLKDMIMRKELLMVVNNPSDDKNDSSSKVEPNVVKDI